MYLHLIGTTFSGVAYTFANEEEVCMCPNEGNSHLGNLLMVSDQVQNESIVTEWGEGLIAERVPT